ncbi:MAG: hypothetical protein R2755_13325 [Acidimicrobiales bacterium]
MMAHVTSTSIQTLKTAAGKMDGVKPEYIERMNAYIDERSATTRITQCITDAKGDRSCPPGKQDDPWTPTCTWWTASDGVVIRGAAAHHRRAVRSRPADHPHEGDEAGRGGGPSPAHGQRTGRAHHQHHLRAAFTRTPARSSFSSKYHYPRGS